ncbi:spermatid nuclear transition protein 4-like [Felis catus]|uniref:spermatid nuclear transition protein 4-like n=1 Tax=Felis catus TaxID=9685 RepID=UPI0003F19E66|nr:spermatid nuclear transition protein 4-like [Felis catus]
MKRSKRSMKQPAPRTKRKKGKKTSCQPKTRHGGKAQKKTKKTKRPLRRNVKNKPPQSSPSCLRMPHRRVRPTIFICYHKLNKTPSENEQSRNKKHWKLQPFQITSCAASKCRAWARNVESATAYCEVAIENCSDT